MWKNVPSHHVGIEFGRKSRNRLSRRSASQLLKAMGAHEALKESVVEYLTAEPGCASC